MQTSCIIVMSVPKLKHTDISTALDIDLHVTDTSYQCDSYIMIILPVMMQ